MPVPTTAIGTSTPPVTVTVERGRLQLFAKATGQSNPLYVDPAFAQAQGHPDLPVPPTYLVAIEKERADPSAWITELGVDTTKVLHATQSFTYDCLVHAGDTLVAMSTITDVFTKKGGALEFIERCTDITRAGQRVAQLTQTAVVRHTT
jgi:acyl dehydratase